MESVYFGATKNQSLANMKKIILILASLFFTFMYANAEYRPGKGDFSTEMYYSPGGSTDGQFALPEYGAKARMFLNDRMALSLNLGVNASSTTEVETDYIPESWREKNSVFAITLMPGFEYHFTRFERVSPYFGAAVGFGYGYTRAISSNVSETDYYQSTLPVVSLGWMLTSGVDVYVCKGLYLGLEFGLGYEFNATGTQKTIRIWNSTTTEEEGGDSMSSSTFGFFATPSLRIGWLF